MQCDIELYFWAYAYFGTFTKHQLAICESLNTLLAACKVQWQRKVLNFGGGGGGAGYIRHQLYAPIARHGVIHMEWGGGGGGYSP